MKTISILQVIIALFFFCSTSYGSSSNLDDLLDSMLTKTNHLPDSSRVRLLVSQGGKFRYNKKMEPILMEGSKVANSNGDQNLIVYTQYHLGNFYQINGHLDTALLILNQLIEPAKKVKDPFMLPSIHNTMGGTYIKMGNIKKGVEELLTAKQIYELIDTTLLSKPRAQRRVGALGVVSNSLAIANQKIENYTEAIKYYDESAGYFIDLGDKNYAGAILSNKGDLLIKLDKYEEALSELNKTIDDIHPMLGEKILSHWQFPRSIADIPQNYIDHNRYANKVDLCDLVSIANNRVCDEAAFTPWENFSSLTRVGWHSSDVDSEFHNLSAEIELAHAVFEFKAQ